MPGPPRRAAPTARAIGAIAANELRRTSRDRLALFFIVVMPVVLITAVGTTFSFREAIDVGVLDRDRTADSARLVQSLERGDGVVVERYASSASLRRDVRTGALAAGVVVPPGYGSTVAAGRDVSVTVIADPTSSAAVTVGVTVRSAVSDEAVQLAAAGFAARALGAEATTADRMARSLAGDIAQPRVVTSSVDPGSAAPGSGRFGYTAPANLVLFVFANTLVAGTILANDRKAGLTRRMLAAPHGTGTVLAGVGCAKLLVALVQSGLVLAVGAVAFGVGWGDPAGAALVVVLFALVAAAVGVLVGAWVSDADQAQAISAPAAIGLAMLGGCVWPLDLVPDAVRVLGHLTPHAWAMDAWVALVSDGAGVGAIVPELAVLAGLAVTIGAVAARRLRLALTA